MLQTSHSGRPYSAIDLRRVSRATRSAPDWRRVAPPLPPAAELSGESASAQFGDSGVDSGKVSQLMELRSELVYRHLRGEPLTDTETFFLRLLTHLANTILPRPDGFSEETRLAIDEAKRIRATRRGDR
jgi:hypothetical protein